MDSVRNEMFIRTVGQIGVWQRRVGLQAESAESYAMAMARVKALTNVLERDYLFLILTETLCDGGDVDVALKATEPIQGAYWKALSYCHCAKALAASRREPEAQALRKKAETLADAEATADHRTDMLAKIAEAAAKADDLPAAKRCLDKALQVSRATKEHKYHVSIARCQVRIGLLDNAYETVRDIPQVERRDLPLAELAREVAKREALARKQGADK
jgi:hypothetical protein